MARRVQLVLLGIGAVVLVLAANASANHLSGANGRLVRGVFSELEFRGGFGTVKCPVTLEASFHSATVNKTLGLLIGYVTRASIGRCLTGSATLLTETLPWHITYNGFSGLLPRPSAFTHQLIGVAFRIAEPAFSIVCLGRSEARHPVNVIEEGISWEAGGLGVVEKTIAEPGASIPCGSFTGRFEGVGRLTESGGLANVSAKLI